MGPFRGSTRPRSGCDIEAFGPLERWSTTDPVCSLVLDGLKLRLAGLFIFAVLQKFTLVFYFFVIRGIGVY